MHRGALTTLLVVISLAQAIAFAAGRRIPSGARSFHPRSTRAAVQGANSAVPRQARAVMVAKGSDAASLKRQITQLCAGTKNGISASEELRTLIVGLAKQLTQMNPTDAPARSSLMAGKWRMLYSDVPGPSSGKLGPFVGDVLQDIRPEERRIFNILELGPSWAVRGALEAHVEIISDNDWAINFDNVYNKLGGLTVAQKKFDANFERRIWNMAYLDQDFRIVFAGIEGTDPDARFIFILRREE